MPAFDGTGPNSYGSMTGRGFGPCGGGKGYGKAQAYPRTVGINRVRGFCRGLGSRRGAGMGWAAVGYGNDGPAAMRAVLEERRDFLRAELARTEAMLTEETNAQAKKDDDKERT